MAHDRGQPSSSGPTDDTLRTRRARRFLLVVVIGYASASLFPFGLDLPRRVANAAVRDRGEVVFPAPGMMVVPEPGSPADLDLPLRLDLEVEATGEQDGPARILSLSSGPHSQSLMVGQSGPDLVVRVRRPGTDDLGSPPLVAPGVLGRPGLVHIAVEVTADEVLLEVDGRRVDTDVGEGLEQWDPAHHLVLGNEHGGARPWIGRIGLARLAWPGAGLDLVSVGELPVEYWRVPARWIAPTPWYRSWELGPVELLHAAALSLVGWFGVRAFPRRRPWTVLGWCWGLSTVTLAAKFAVGGRHPAVGDAVVELLGAAAGVAAARWAGRATASSSSPRNG